MENNNLEKINELIAQNEFKEAKKQLNELLATDGKNIEALKLLGLCNVNLENYKEGKSVFETVVKYKNDDATSWYYLANCYDNLSDFLHAKPAYLKVIELRENYMDAYKHLGVIYIKNNEPQKALELAQKALNLEKNDYLFYYLAGTALLAMKNFKECIPYFMQAIELNEKHSQLYNNLGTAYLTTGDYEKAYEIYKKSSELDPKNSLTFYNIASILQIKNKNKEACEFFEKAYSIEPLEQYLVSLALSEFKSEQFESAIKHYKMLITQHPEKHNFQYNLACCYEMTGEYTYAIGILEQLTLLNPKSKIMSQKLANLYLLTGKPLKAKEIYERIIARGLVSAEIYYEYALICVQTDDVDIAEKILKKVIELNPNNAGAHKDLGVIYLSKRLFDYAKDEFEQAYKLIPDDFNILFEYANFLQATSDFKGAKELYEKAMDKAPKGHKIPVFSALNNIALNNLDGALKDIKIALKTLPIDAFILFTAGKIYHLLKDYEMAQDYLIKSLEISQTLDTQNLLALNYFALEEWERANTLFQNILSKSPYNTNVLLQSANCYIKLSQIDDARRMLHQALEVLPELDEAQELLDSLDKIGETN